MYARKTMFILPLISNPNYNWQNSEKSFSENLVRHLIYLPVAIRKQPIINKHLYDRPTYKTIIILRI